MDSDDLESRCLEWANKHTLGNIARVGVGCTKELADSVLALVRSELERAATDKLKDTP